MTNDGGPAFPSAQLTRGMSLRDYFAGQALTVVVNMAAWTPELAPRLAGHETVEHKFAFNAYRLADAMIAEREK